MPLPLDSLQLASPAVTEAEVRSRHHIPDGFGDENLVTLSLRHHTRRDVNRDPAQKPALLTHLADVQAGPYLEVEFLRVMLEPPRGADRADRPLERRHEPISGAVDDATPVRTHGLLGSPVIVREELAPPFVAK
jgi:hypothetical protein